ncbi:hypothetical protein MHU86_23666 [Fragilaria crotonensis]|nr:hypothetical protein MHU86_23666 [Fragilaria crotonensis]
MKTSTVLVWCCSLIAATPSSSFVVPFDHGRRSSITHAGTATALQAITTVDDPDTKTDSKRLSKAKRLLQDLMIENADATSSMISIIPNNSTSVVPETYWSNGHLQPGAGGMNNNYVTRWAGGVKVAEPWFVTIPLPRKSCSSDNLPNGSSGTFKLPSD